MSDDEKKVKDGWDKAAIISSFLSSVIIAGVGLLINASIQETQLRTSQENAAAQSRQAKETADSQRKLQEAALTGQLVEHLASNDAVKRRIAIVALQSAVPPETYQTVASIVIQLDTNKDVRITAYQQAATLAQPTRELTKNVAAASQDAARSVEERGAAKAASDTIQERLLASLQPEAAELAKKLIQNSKDKGIEIRIISGYRSAEEQASFVAAGVSKAQFSVHMTGLAFDIGIFEEGKFVSEGKPYLAVGEIGKALGLRWGGDQRQFVDMPHFETQTAATAVAKLREAASSQGKP